MIPFQSLRARLGLLILLSFVPIIGLTVYWSYREQAPRLAEVEASGLRLARQVATTYGQIIWRARDNLMTLAQTYVLREGDATACSALIASLLPRYPQYSNLVVADPDGNVSCGNLHHAGAVSVKDYASFAQVVATQDFAVGNVEDNQITGQEFIAPAYPVLDRHGALRAVAVAILDQNYMNETAAQTVLPSGSVLAVFDRSGRITAHQPDPQKWVGASMNAAMSAALARGVTQIESPSLDGISRRFGLAAVDGVPAPAALYVSIGFDPRQTVAPIRAALYRNVAILVGMALLAMGLAWFAIERSVIQRVNALLAATRRLASGDLGARASAGGGPSELQHLGSAFDSMAMALQERGRERDRAEEILRQAQAAARESEQNLAVTLNSIGDALITTDTKGLITRMNPAAEQFTGWPLVEAAGRPLTEVFNIVNADTRVLAADPVQRVLEFGKAVGLANHTMLLARGGQEYQIADTAAPIRDAAGHIAGVVLVFSDVTQNYQAEAERARLAAIVENSSEAIFSRTFDGTILTWNAGAERMLGYTAAEVIGRPITLALPPGRSPTFQGNNDRLRRGETVVHEANLLTKDGRLIDFRANVSPVRDRGGKIVGASAILQDITESKQARAALMESEARFRNTFDQAPIGVAHTALDRRFLMVNPKLCAMLGYTQEELLALRSSDVSHPDDVAGEGGFRTQLIAGEISVHASEKRYLRKDCTVIWTQRTVSAARDRAGLLMYFIVMIEDISARKQADAEHTRLAAIVDASTDAIVSRDLEGRILSWNHGAERLFGFSKAEMMGRDIRVLTPPALQSELRIGRETAADFQARSHDSARLAKDGHLIDVSISAAPIRDAAGSVSAIALIFRDISERKQAEAALGKAAQRLDIALEGSRISVWETDLRSNDVWLDDTWATLLGKAAAETHTTAAELLTLVPEEDRQGIVTAAVQTMKGEISNYTIDHRVKTATGEWLWIQSRGRVIERDSSGRPLRMSGTNTDISERKQAEATRASLEAQLRESQKMQAIGTLAGGIAHDFNNIIAIILGHVDIARQDAGHLPPVLESLERIHQAGVRARDLVRQILAFSRRQPTERKPISLIPVVEQTGRLLRATLPARLTLEVHCEPEVPPVLADASHIQQALINLATNAMQAMRNGPGRIRIRLDTVILDAALAQAHPALDALHTQHPGRRVRIARLVLSDNGPGMDAVTRARIFEPFFTTKPVGEGTGLGLSVVHGIVDGHQGAIEVDSEPGRGSTFTLYLPLSESVSPAGVASGMSTKAPAPSPGGGSHVLYIDDDAELVYLVQHLLERRGYRVSTYTDAQQALQALRATPAEFDLLLTDYNMPGMSGLDVAREARIIRPELPVAVTSGFIDETVQAQAAEAGVRELIFKADSVDSFCDAVQRLLQASAQPKSA